MQKKPFNNELLSYEHFIGCALSEARKAPPDVPVGAVVVLGQKIIGRGFNKRESTADPTAHAEILAIRQAASYLQSWRLSGATLYSTLEPCPMCAEAIIQSRLERLVFGAWDPLSGAAGSAFNLFVPGRIYPLPEVIGGIREEECRQLLVEFFAAIKKT